jgi:hypothetical protein
LELTFCGRFAERGVARHRGPLRGVERDVGRDLDFDFSGGALLGCSASTATADRECQQRGEGE